MKSIRTVRRRRPIYVESRINAPMDRVWDATQQPVQHERWDLRFGTIWYLPRIDGEPQRFTYATTLALGRLRTATSQRRSRCSSRCRSTSTWTRSNSSSRRSQSVGRDRRFQACPVVSTSRTDDGTARGRGRVYRIASGHDAWVGGDEPAVVVEFQGTADYAERH